MTRKWPFIHCKQSKIGSVLYTLEKLSKSIIYSNQSSSGAVQDLYSLNATKDRDFHGNESEIRWTRSLEIV